MIGRAYDPHREVSDPSNGAFSKASQLGGVFIVMYAGTLSIMLFVNLIPGIAVLQFSLRVTLMILALLFCCFLTGTALAMNYLVQPQDTFTHSVVVGTQDPILSTIGVFFATSAFSC